MRMSFDDILNFLTDMVKSELFLVANNEQDLAKMSDETRFIKNLKKEIRKIRITNNLLKTLEVDYENFKLKMKAKMAHYNKKI